MGNVTLPVDDVLRLGIHIKSKRTELGLSLRDLSVTTGLSATFLSNLERGIANPTLDSLRKVSSALNTPIFYMADVNRDTNPVVHINQRRSLNLKNGHIRCEVLTHSINKKMVIFQAHISSNEGDIGCGPLAEPTEECLVMLSGRINITLSGQSYELEAGDSIYFEGCDLEGIKVLGDEEATYISAITPAVF